MNDDGEITFMAASDAAIVQGLVALLLRVYSGRTPDEIRETEPEFLAKIGLDSHLSATRKNGLASMVTAIKAAAAQVNRGRLLAHVRRGASDCNIPGNISKNAMPRQIRRPRPLIG